MTERLFTTEELAEYLKVKPATVYTWNSKKIGPKITRVGRRGVRYAESDVDAWLAANDPQAT